MDRREALKRLGGGAVVVVGASTIVSSPAFAYDQPTPGIPAGLTFGFEALSLAQFSISDGTATCPGSANDANATVTARSTLLTTVTALPPFGIGSAEFRLGFGGSAFPQTTTTSVFTVAKFRSGLGTPTVFLNGDSFEAEITITFQCAYSDGTTRDRAVTTSRTATRIGGAWSVA